MIPPGRQRATVAGNKEESRQEGLRSGPCRCWVLDGLQQGGGGARWPEKEESMKWRIKWVWKGPYSVFSFKNLL